MSSLGSSQISRFTGCFKASKHRDKDKTKGLVQFETIERPRLRRHHSPAFRAPCGLVAARRIFGSPRPFPENWQQTQHASTCGKCSPAFLYSCNLPISRKASCSPSASRSLAKKKTASQMHNCTPLVKALKVSKLWFNSIDRFVLFDLPRLRHCLFAGPNNNYWLYNAVAKRALPEVSTWITWRLAYNKSTLPLQ